MMQHPLFNAGQKLPFSHTVSALALNVGEAIPGSLDPAESNPNGRRASAFAVLSGDKGTIIGLRKLTFGCQFGTGFLIENSISYCCFGCSSWQRPHMAFSPRGDDLMRLVRSLRSAAPPVWIFAGGRCRPEGRASLSDRQWQCACEAGCT